MSTLGANFRQPSVGGSRLSVYSSGSTIRTARTGGKAAAASRSAKSMRTKWYKKPLVASAFYTDLQRGSWHIGFYSVFVSIWTTLTSAFDIYCLHEATPGSSHTGYYIISFDFVYVGNGDVRNLLMSVAVFSMLGGVVLFFASCYLLDGLRKEDEKTFQFWLWTMGIFAPFKVVSWAFSGIVNDMIFVYNVLMLLAWFGFNIINCFGWVCIYSLYLELRDLSKLQDLAKLKMDTMSSVPASRGAGSIYGRNNSRPTSPSAPNPTYASLGPSEASRQSRGAQYQYSQQQPTQYTTIQQQHQNPQIVINPDRNAYPSAYQDPVYATRGQGSQSSDIF